MSRLTIEESQTILPTEKAETGFTLSLDQEKLKELKEINRLQSIGKDRIIAVVKSEILQCESEARLKEWYTKSQKGVCSLTSDLQQEIRDLWRERLREINLKP